MGLPALVVSRSPDGFGELSVGLLMAGSVGGLAINAPSRVSMEID